MDASGSGPVVLTAEEQAVLNEGIGLILSRWTAMRAAVDNGWGGRDSQGKAERILSTVFDFFINSKDPMDFDGLADILQSGLENELNTVADDGSVDEVTDKLLDLYEDCLKGEYQTVEKLRVTNSQKTATVVKVSNGNEEEDEESDDEDEDNDQSTDMIVDDASDRKPAAAPVDEPPKADDGWTVVSSRKNKGKRN